MRLVASIFVGIWMARYLGPESFGIFSYSLSFVAILGPIAKLGLDHIVVRVLTKSPEKKDEYIGTAFWLKIIGAILLLCLVAVSVQATSNDNLTNLYIFIIASGVIFQSFDVVDFYFQSKVLNKYVSICKIFQLGLSSLLKIALILFNADLIWFVLVILIDNILLALALFIAYHSKKSGSLWAKFSLVAAKELLMASWPLALTSYATLIFMHIDKVMIKEMLGAVHVGHYAAAVKISEAYYFLPLIIATSVFPAIINAKKISEKLYTERLQNLHLILLWMSVAVALVVTFIGESLITFLFGAAYVPAGQVLIVHVWGGVFVSVSIASKRWFIIEELQHLLLVRALISTVCNIILNLLLIPKYGILGSAVATLISLCLVWFTYLFNPRLWTVFLFTIKSIFPIYLFKKN